MSSLIARVDGAITLLGAPAKVVEKLRRELSFPNQDYLLALRMNRPTGDIPERVYAAHEVPEGVTVPRGAYSIIKKIALECGYDVVVRDERMTGRHIEMRKPSGLRDYQIEGAEKAKRILQGVIVLPCGGGKTTLGIAAIAEAETTTLVIVPTRDLLKQWCEGIEKHLDQVAGTYSGGEVRLGPIVVAVVDSLHNGLSRMPEFGRLFGFVIVDEVHRCPAALYQSVLSHLPAKRRLGLTATPDREDGLSKLIEWSFGDRILERSADELISAGWLTIAEVKAFETNFRFHYVGSETKRLAALGKSLASDAERNRFIGELVSRDAERGETVLVLSSRKDHLHSLSQYVSADHAVLTSKNRNREDILNRFRSGSLPVLLATNLADEGLDIPRLSRVVLAMPERARGRTMQRVGRVTRNFPGKKPFIYDFIDRSVETLVHRWEARRRTYRKLGLPVREVTYGEKTLFNTG